MKRLLILAALAVMLGGEAKADFITQWNFDSTTPDSNTGTGTTNPSFGFGTASLVGGTTATFATGNGGGADNSGWNTTNYAASTTGNKTRGVQFSASTAGYQNITISWEQRHSNTAANTVSVQATSNGTTWIDVQTFTFTPAATGTGDTWYTRSVVLSNAYDNTSNFGFRILAAFDSGTGNYLASRSTSTYGTTGTWRFDNVKIEGAAVPEPTTGLLIGIGTLACAAFRRNRRVA
jgi:hypothetical protein